MGLPQDFLEIVYQNEDTAVSIGCVCLANIMRLLRLKHSAIILHSAILGVLAWCCTLLPAALILCSYGKVSSRL